MTSVYRDGVAAARGDLAARRRTLLLRGVKLGEMDRGGLGATLRRELDELEARLAAMSLRDAAGHAEDLLRAYDCALEAAAGVLGQRRSRQRIRRRGALLSCAALLTMVACRYGWQLSDYGEARSDCAHLCDYNGKCHLSIEHDFVDGIRYQCVARDDADCATPCAAEGRCQVFAGSCVARSDAGCEASEACKTLGRCRATGSVCETAADDHCRQSTACHDRGRCSFDASTRGCRAVSALDCAVSAACTEQGLCNASYGECVGTQAATREECYRISACVDANMCDPVELDAACRGLILAREDAQDFAIY